ncbi:uncharacterized protein VTP21DRAFT_3972 [Calcarisporiella thermophila]|uniref:uncharacterized protein n=1 Tax=Calcarisporiella thermophila TaxID=911321 RepID=UPI0037439A25
MSGSLPHSIISHPLTLTRSLASKRPRTRSTGEILRSPPTPPPVATEISSSPIKLDRTEELDEETLAAQTILMLSSPQRFSSSQESIPRETGASLSLYDSHQSSLSLSYSPLNQHQQKATSRRLFPSTPSFHCSFPTSDAGPSPVPSKPYFLVAQSSPMPSKSPPFSKRPPPPPPPAFSPIAPSPMAPRPSSYSLSIPPITPPRLPHTPHFSTPTSRRLVPSSELNTPAKMPIPRRASKGGASGRGSSTVDIGLRWKHVDALMFEEVNRMSSTASHSAVASSYSASFSSLSSTPTRVRRQETITQPSETSPLLGKKVTLDAKPANATNAPDNLTAQTATLPLPVTHISQKSTYNASIGDKKNVNGLKILSKEPEFASKEIPSRKADPELNSSEEKLAF